MKFLVSSFINLIADPMRVIKCYQGYDWNDRYLKVIKKQRASWIIVRLIDSRRDAPTSAFRENAASPSIMGKCKCMFILKPLLIVILFGHIFIKRGLTR